MRYDLCLAYNWDYDEDFIGILNSACATRGLTLLTLAPRDLPVSLPLLASGEAGFSTLLDRASEADPAFLPLVEIARTRGARRLNPRELADRAYDKAAMHLELTRHGIVTPQTYILASYYERPRPWYFAERQLRGRYTVKPALGGGGDGVVMDVTTFEQVQTARQEFPDQQYLLQAHVTPAMLDDLPAWFRVIYCLGEIHSCFWDTATHVYTPLTPEAEERLGLAGLREVTRRIADVCGLDLFSTEIARTEEGQLQVVDYVNDPIDLRLKSHAKDGVPDEIVEQIARRIAEEVKRPPR